MFGFQDDTSEELKGSGGGQYPKFGLNTGVFLTKIEYKPNGGRDGAPAEVVDYEFTVPGGKFPFNGRIWKEPMLFGKNGPIQDKTSEEYKKKFDEAWAQSRGIMTHIMKAFVTGDQLKERLSSTKIVDFKTWAEAQISLLPANYAKIELDLFLHYQWNIKGDNDKTYLELPKNMKNGYWVTPSLKQDWKEVKDEIKGLSYVGAGGEEHPFKRNPYYMESNNAVQQSENPSSDEANEALAAPSAPATADSDSVW